MSLTKRVPAALAGLALLTPLAGAAVISGTNASETLVGTARADLIDARGATTPSTPPRATTASSAARERTV